MSAPITVVGRLVDIPELRFTPQGMAVAKMRVATSVRGKDGDNWVDKDRSFWAVSAFRQLAENVAESLGKGDLVVITGRIKQREYEDKEGNKRTVYEIAADEIGASLRFHPVKVQRTERGKADAFTPDPWSTQ